MPTTAHREEQLELLKDLHKEVHGTRPDFAAARAMSDDELEGWIRDLLFDREDAE